MYNTPSSIYLLCVFVFYAIMLRYAIVCYACYHHHRNTVSVIADHYDWHMMIVRPNACAMLLLSMMLTTNSCKVNKRILSYLMISSDFLALIE